MRKHGCEYSKEHQPARHAPGAISLLVCALTSGCVEAPAPQDDGSREPESLRGYVQPEVDSEAADDGGSSSDAGGSSARCDDRAREPSVGRESCLTISAGSLDGYKVSDVARLLGDSRAQSPDYAYLVAHQDAARLRAPLVTGEDGIEVASLQLQAARIEPLTSSSGKDPVYQVEVPGSAKPLRYVITAVDFEGEVDLRHVELCRNHDQLSADFIFAGAGTTTGIAHAVTLRVEYAGSVLRSSAPVALEVR